MEDKENPDSEKNSELENFEEIEEEN